MDIEKARDLFNTILPQPSSRLVIKHCVEILEIQRDGLSLCDYAEQLQAENEQLRERVKELETLLYDLLVEIRNSQKGSMGGFQDTYLPQLRRDLIDKKWEWLVRKETP